MGKRILMVCKGNICRSPAAEVVLSAGLDGDIEIRSRGTRGWHKGKGANEVMINVAAEFGYDLRSHIADTLSEDDMNWATDIFAMDRETQDAIMSLHPLSDHSKIRLFLADGEDLSDPFGESESVFVACFRRIEARATQLRDQLKSTVQYTFS